MTEENKPDKKIDAETIDLMKVQIYADRCHAKFTSLLAFVFAYFLTLMAIFYGVLYQNLPISIITWSVGTPATAISTVIFLVVILRDYLGDFRAISEMIETVENGKQLPRLSELSSRKKTRKRSNQPK